MGLYKIKDFSIGESIYHLSNPKLTMVVKQIHPDMNEISCRWIDKNGVVQCVEFMPEELGKADDLRPRMRIHAL